MLPIRDTNYHRTKAYAVYGIIAINVAVFLFELSLSETALRGAMMRFGIVPARVTAALRGQGPFLSAIVVPAFTSMFIHGGWAHLLGNMWYLFVFGDNVEDRAGRVPFLAFYLFCGLAAGATHYALSPASKLPTVGASGAIAGVLGAYAVTWPKARVLTIIPIFYFIHFAELPALIVLGFWFVIQLLMGTASLGVAFDHGGTAYWAHIGGFVTGALLALLLPLGRSKSRRRDYGRWG